MEIFDKRFVYFMWDDELEGKKVFVEDYIGDLCTLVEKGNKCDLHKVRKSDDVDAPFQANDDLNFTFAYYDPNYEVKKAFNEGKKIEFCHRYAPGCWLDATTPTWNADIKYRVKTECPCADGIDSKACVGCEHSEDGKRIYKPYVTVDEFIQDYQERFPTAVPRPAYTMPLIWLKEKVGERINLCYAFVGNCIELGCGVYNMMELFEDWTYLDGSPIGVLIEKAFNGSPEGKEC